MAQVEEDILAEGVQIIWVLEANRQAQAGTAVGCRGFMDGSGSDKGICVGDGQTMPTARAWDMSDVAIRRGFDLLVRRNEMQVLWTSTHGTPGGNENLTGADVLAEVRRIKNGG